MKEFLENAMGALGGSFAIVFFAVGQFPGGTILMAMSWFVKQGLYWRLSKKLLQIIIGSFHCHLVLKALARLGAIFLAMRVALVF